MSISSWLVIVKPSFSYSSSNTRSTIKACHACSRTETSSASAGILPVRCWKEALYSSTLSENSSKVISSPAISPMIFWLALSREELGLNKSPPKRNNINPPAITPIARPVRCLICLINAMVVTSLILKCRKIRCFRAKFKISAPTMSRLRKYLSR